MANTLSNKKLKYIRRHAGSESPEAIAKALGMPVSAVEQVLAEEGLSAPSLPALSGGGGPALNLGLVYALFVALTPFIFHPKVAEASRTPQAAWLQVGGLVLLLVWVATRGRQITVNLGPRWVGALALAFLGWCVLSLLWAANIRDSLDRLLMWLAMPVLYLLALNLFRERREHDRFLVYLYASAIAVSIIGLCQYYFGLEFFLQTARPASTFVNKNMAVHYVVLMTPVTLYLFVRARRAWEYSLIALGGALMLGYCFHTYTKAAWLAVVIQTVLVLAYCGGQAIRGRRVLPMSTGHWAAAAGCLALLFTIIHLVPVEGGFAFQDEVRRAFRTVRATVDDIEKFEQLKNRRQVDPSGGRSADQISIGLEAVGLKSMESSSLAVRLVCWKNTLMMYRDHPACGVGLGNFRGYYDRYARSWTIDKFWPANEWHRTHNDFLQVLVETGAIGFLLLAALLGRLAWISLRRLWATPDDMLTLTLLIALAGLAVNACFCFPFDRTVPPVVISCFAAILAIQAGRGGLPMHEITVSRDLRPLAMGAIGLALIVFAWAQYHLVVGDLYARKVYDAEARKDHEAVVYFTRKLLEVDPWNKRMLVREGRALTDLGHPQHAVPVLKELVQTYPFWYLGLHNLAVACQRSGQFETAISTAERALKLFPEAAETFNVIGCAYLDAKEAYKKQLDDAAKAGDLDRVVAAKTAIANALDQAEAAFRRARAIDGSNREYVYNIGLVYYWRKLVSENPEEWRRSIETAIQYMRDSIALDDRYALPWKDIGAMYANDLMDEEHAAECFTRALELDPKVDGAAGLRNYLKQHGYPIPPPQKPAGTP